MATLAFEELISNLQNYWSGLGYAIRQPIDFPVGAGTSHPATFFGALSANPCAWAYVQPCRRPSDGRYGNNPIRQQHYYQFQVLSKPAPCNPLDLYLSSLSQALKIDLTQHDLRFVEDNWENPSLGAGGLGWEVWLDGMEISQLTYFQQIGGITCSPAVMEWTYGLERIALLVQGCESVSQLVWHLSCSQEVRYGHIFDAYEAQESQYNFERADIQELRREFEVGGRIVQDLLKLDPPLYYVAYLKGLKMAEAFNLLESRNALSVSERKRYILLLREANKHIAQTYLKSQP